MYSYLFKRFLNWRIVKDLLLLRVNSVSKSNSSLMMPSLIFFLV